jgi:hypothetical protein
MTLRELRPEAGDTAVAVRVFRMAKEKGIGRELPLWSEKREAATGSSG